MREWPLSIPWPAPLLPKHGASKECVLGHAIMKDDLQKRQLHGLFHQGFSGLSLLLPNLSGKTPQPSHKSPSNQEKATLHSQLHLDLPHRKKLQQKGPQEMGVAEHGTEISAQHTYRNVFSANSEICSLKPSVR